MNFGRFPPAVSGDFFFFVIREIPNFSSQVIVVLVSEANSASLQYELLSIWTLRGYSNVVTEEKLKKKFKTREVQRPRRFREKDAVLFRWTS